MNKSCLFASSIAVAILLVGWTPVFGQVAEAPYTCTVTRSSLVAKSTGLKATWDGGRVPSIGPGDKFSIAVSNPGKVTFRIANYIWKWTEERESGKDTIITPYKKIVRKPVTAQLGSGIKVSVSLPNDPAIGSGFKPTTSNRSKDVTAVGGGSIAVSASSLASTVPPAGAKPASNAKLHSKNPTIQEKNFSIKITVTITHRSK